MIDVVIPVYNGARFLSEAVDSALGQTFCPSQVILVDDGSTDETPSIASDLAEAYPHHVRYLQTEHQGVSGARNAGIAVSSSPFVAFLDADDVWLSDKLRIQLAVFEGAGPDVGLVHSSYVHIDEHGELIDEARVVPPGKRGNLFKALLFEDYVLSGSASAALVRREYLDRAGYFDERLAQGEDWDLWVRLAALCRFDFAPQPLVKIRIHSGSAQRTAVANRGVDFALQRAVVYAKWADRVPEFADHRPAMRAQVATILLSDTRRPAQVELFYRLARRQGDVLFGTRWQLWAALMRQILRLRVIQLFVGRLARDMRGRRGRR